MTGQFSIRSIFAVVLYVAICVAATFVNWRFFALLQVFVLFALLIATVGAVYELGECRAFCFGFSVFGWVFWIHEFTMNLWSVAPLWTIVGEALEAASTDFPDGLSSVVQITFFLGICLLGGRFAAASYRRNYGTAASASQLGADSEQVKSD